MDSMLDLLQPFSMGFKKQARQETSFWGLALGYPFHQTFRQPFTTAYHHFFSPHTTK